MNRQYIGARYVPKIFDNNGSNEWVSGIAYEPLTIVTYLNNSYTSKKPVPSTAGSPNSATEYWANTGNYVGVVSELTEKVSTIEGELVDIADRTCGTPDMFNAPHSGDATLELQALLNSDYKYIRIDGEYTVDTLIIPSNKVIEGVNATLHINEKIELNNKANTIISDIKFDGVAEESQETILEIHRSHNIIVKRCEFTEVYGGTISGYGIVDVRNSYECYFINDEIHGSNCEGLLIVNSHHCGVKGGRYYDNLRGSGVHVSVADSENTGYNIVDGVECYNNAGSNIGMSGKRCICVNCFVHDNDDTTYAIVLGHENWGGTNCIVANNTILNCNNGIYLYGASESLVANNIIDNGGKSNAPRDNEGIACSANCYNIVAENNIIKGCDVGIVGVELVSGCYIMNCTYGVKKGANPNVNTRVKNSIIKGCTYGAYSALSVENCEINTTTYCIFGEGRFTDNTLTTTGEIAIYEGASTDLSFITNNVISAAERAIYSTHGGVFEYNMILNGNTITAPNMTATNNYDFSTL